MALFIVNRAFPNGTASRLGERIPGRDDRSIRWQHAAVPRVGEAKTDIEIWIDLGAAMAKLDARNKPEYWTENLKAEWKDYGKLWAEFVARTPGVG